MPILDGIEATKIIRSKGIMSPIIGLSANADSHSREQAEQAGMWCFVSKPMSLDDLRKAIEKCSNMKTRC